MGSVLTRFALLLTSGLASAMAQAGPTTEILSGAGFDELAQQLRGQPMALHVHRRPPAGEAAVAELEAVAGRILTERGMRVDPAADVQIVLDPGFYVATDRFVPRDTPLSEIYEARMAGAETGTAPAPRRGTQPTKVASAIVTLAAGLISPVTALNMAIIGSTGFGEPKLVGSNVHGKTLSIVRQPRISEAGIHAGQRLSMMVRLRRGGDERLAMIRATVLNDLDPFPIDALLEASLADLATALR